MTFTDTATHRVGLRRPSCQMSQLGRAAALCGVRVYVRLSPVGDMPVNVVKVKDECAFLVDQLGPVLVRAAPPGLELLFGLKNGNCSQLQ